MGFLSFARISFESVRYFNMTWRDGQVVRPTNTISGTSPTPAPSVPYLEQALTFTVVLMAILGAALSVVGLERLICGRFTLSSAVHVLLRCTFLLFLPLLSYMFSHTQEQDKAKLLLVLLWMLLIELIRKKVHAMVQSADGSFSRAVGRFRLRDHSDEVTHLVWIGYLIYTNMEGQDPVVVAMFVILWSLALAKLGQRVLNKWKAQDSLAAAGNTHLIAGYMQHVLLAEEPESGSSAGASTNVLAKCKYVVMGEEKLVLKKKQRQKRDLSTGARRECKVLSTPHCGYGVGRFPHDQNEQKHVHLLIDLNKVDGLVTVKDIWQNPPPLPFGKWGRQFIEDMRILCLSFSFFKLLRRRFERYPMVEVGSKMSRRLMLEGLLTLDLNQAASADNADDNAINAFKVLQMELDFLNNYYQAGVPIVMSAPWIFFFNFVLSLLFVFIYVLAIPLTVDPSNAITELRYMFIALLLTITLLAIETTEFLTLYLLSNWFLVHLICLYAVPGNCLWNWLFKPIICCFIAARFLVFCALRFLLRLFGRPVNTDKMKIKQVSILQVCEPIHKLWAWTSEVTLATKAKVAIVKSLKGINPPDTGNVSLPHINGLNSHGKTATEIILACHLATELVEIKHGKRKKKKKKKHQPEDDRTVATTLSRYCMYLVERAPELLPDDEGWVSDKYEDMKSCLKKASCRCCCGVSCTWSRCRAWETVMDADTEDLQDPTTQGGVKLFHQRKDRDDKDAVWKELADFWVELLVYLAPSNDVEGHAEALASSGGDLITCLWAFCTHAGISRQPQPPEQAERHDDADKPGVHQV